MITRVMATALAAGFAAGLLVALLQHFTTTPLIIAAEAFEGAAAHSPASQRVAHSALYGGEIILAHQEHSGEAGAWTPADGLERTFYTSTVTVATAVGFSFLLLAALLVAGDVIDMRRALVWGVAGFVVTGLAPALGLPPELPGMLASDLLDRQVWWIGTAAATAVSLWLMLRSGRALGVAAGAALLVLPHVVGAPHPPAGGASGVPAELAARFAATSLAVQAVLWALTGASVGWFWHSMERADDRSSHAS